MCLDYKLPKSEIEKLPKEFVAYKAVWERESGKYYPPIYNSLTRIAATNRLRRMYILQRTTMGYLGKKKESYVPYYHSFRTKRGAKKWGAHACIIKIKIKRKDVTCIGTQDNCKVIVSRALTTDFEEIQ